MDQLLIHIDSGLKSRLKMRALTEGKTIKTVVTEAIVSYMGADLTAPLATPTEKNHTCMKCNKSWTGTKHDPKVCPYCKSYDWKDAAVVNYSHKCQACSFDWTSKKESPAICPSCRSYAWNGASPKVLRNKFYNIYRSSGLSTQDLAPAMNTTPEKLVAFVKGTREVTAAHLAVLEAAVAKLKI